MAETNSNSHAITLSNVARQLMPGGNPDYLGMIKYPTIAAIKQEIEPAKLLTYVAMLVQNFCAAFNVARNMTEAQIIEAAAMLVEECGNFRLEDYTVMFAMAKRGELVKIYERIDLSVITEIADEYYARRRDAKIDMEESELERQEAQLVTPKTWDTPKDRAAMRDMHRSVESIAGAISGISQGLRELKDAENFKNGTAGKMDA